MLTNIFEYPYPLYGCIFIIIFIIIILLYEEIPAFKYKLKFMIYIIYVSTVTLLSFPLYFIKPKSVENIQWTAPFIRSTSKILGIEWEINGYKYLEKYNEPCIIICNHQSILDILGMAEIWKYIKKCAVVAKKEILYVFPFGIGAWLCGTIFINRSNSNKSKVTISTSVQELYKNKTKLWIFPEGTRYKGNECLLPFKKGAFYISIQYKLPIIPIIISPYTFINDQEYIFNSGKMIISILQPIEYKEECSLDELIKSTHVIMTNEYKRVSKLAYKQNKKLN